MNITGEDFTYRELNNYADFLRRELTLVPGVKKVSLAGIRKEAIVIEISQTKLAALNINPEHIFNLVNTHNTISNSGNILVNGHSIRLHPTGAFNSIYELENMPINSPDSEHIIYLKDIASIKRVFEEHPDQIYRENGAAAISLGISLDSNVNAVKVGKLVNKRLKQLDKSRPVGMEINKVYSQSEVVSKSIHHFLINLAVSISIVILVLLIVLGIKSGIIMGIILLLTMLGTFIVMYLMNITLQIISLGALIVSLGMLVDNALVVIEGIIVNLCMGDKKLTASQKVIQQTQWPLLGATIIAIIAFAPIGFSQDATGEFCYSLFQVIFISLTFSWLTAITLTPFLCNFFFKESPPLTAEVDPTNKEKTKKKYTSKILNSTVYDGIVFKAYYKFLNWCIKHWILVFTVIFSLLVASIFNTRYVKNVFFPLSKVPIFFVDAFLPEGITIQETKKITDQLEQEISRMPNVNLVTTVIGSGAQRFVLPYHPEKHYPSYGQLIIETKKLKDVDLLIPKIDRLIQQKFNTLEYNIKRMENGPSSSAKIEARFYGNDIEILRKIAHQAITVFEKYNARNVRHSFRNKTLIARPDINVINARKSNISKQQIDDALLINFSGKQVGLYHDGSHLLSIIARAPEEERIGIKNLTSLQVWSKDQNAFIPAAQIIKNFQTEWENPLILRRDRKRMISVFADPDILSQQTADDLLKKVRPSIEALPLPEGYKLEWGGEAQAALQAKSNLFHSLPLGYIVMLLITILIFNSIRKSLAVWITVPLSIIGVVCGLLLFNAPFNFMALLGFLSLSGMLIKNGIVLVDQINIESKHRISTVHAVLNASVSRFRPVCAAAITTTLGMVPLMFDPFFKSMAITIIFGFGFATMLTLIVLPVMYVVLHNPKV